MNYNLLLIKVDAREKLATKVQEILTNYGCYIKIRLGLHDLPANACSASGLIILELLAEEDIIKKFKNELNELDGVKAKDAIM